MTMDATISQQTNFSTKDIARFSSGVTGYRIVRLSIELFLVVRINELSLGVSQAGLVYLLYSLANIATGLILFKFPMAILMGASTQAGALVFPVLSAGAMTGGLIGMFLAASFETMIVSSLFSGFGAASWFIYYQTLTNMAFSKSQLGLVSQMRQGYECLGFLLPSVCLAIINSSSHTSADTTSSKETEGFFLDMSIVQQSVLVLGIIGGVCHLVSFPMMTSCATTLVATKGSTSDEEQQDEEVQQEQQVQDSVWEALKQFFGTSVREYFLLLSVLVAATAIFLGTTSLTTEVIFGLEPTLLWIAAIGFPLGGIVSVGSSIFLGSLVQRDPKTTVLGGTARLSLTFALVAIIYPIVSVERATTAKVFLFIFGLTVGIIYSGTYVAALELWFLRLKDCKVSFVSRASALNDLGFQAVIAAVFQLQTILVEETINDETSKIVEGLVFFGPLVGLLLLAHLVTQRLPYPKDPIFGWPVQDPFGGRKHRIIMALADTFGVCPIASSSFAYFSDFRTSMFANYHLPDSAQVQTGPAIDPTTPLGPDSFEQHLQKFDEECGNTSQDIWYRSTANLDTVTIGNASNMEERLQLIAKAKSEIWITTWCFEDSQTGNQLAEALIQKVQDGVDVRVIVDACNLFYLYHKEKLTKKTQETKVLLKLVKGRVQVKMLDTWFEDKQPSYVCGSHRKMMLIDDSILMTGGRNISDEYLTSKGFHFTDIDVTITSSFSNNARALYEDLWCKSRGVHHLTRDIDNDIKHKAKTFNDAKDDADIESTESSFFDVDLDNGTENCSSAPNSSIVLQNECLVQSPLDPPSPLSIDRQVALFQLDHRAGNPEGQDITFSTLLYLIETAQEKIDLAYGYFQLLPGLESAIAKAIERGVKIRLITNSDDTVDLTFYNGFFGQALRRVLEVGVEVYLPAPKTEEGSVNPCFHYKMALIDDKAVLLGSWNCFGVSVFHDDEFSVVMFDQSSDVEGGSTLGATLFEPFEEAAKEGHIVRIESIPEGSFVVPFHFRTGGSKNCTRQMKRGF